MDRHVYFSNETTFTVENGVCHVAIDPDLGRGVVVHFIGDVCVGYRIIYAALFPRDIDNYESRDIDDYESESYALGCDARNDLRPIDENPYDHGCEDHQDWAQGWFDADRELEAEEEDHG